MEFYESQAKLFKVLMHPVRLAILDILKDGEQCVCHIEANLGYRQAYISQQLMVLRESGLVEDRRDGWNIFYRVVKPEIYAVIEAATEVTGAANRPLPIKRVGDACACPKCSTVPQPAKQ